MFALKKMLYQIRIATVMPLLEPWERIIVGLLAIALLLVFGYYGVNLAKKVSSIFWLLVYALLAREWPELCKRRDTGAYVEKEYNIEWTVSGWQQWLINVLSSVSMVWTTLSEDGVFCGSSVMGAFI